ncbi:hypothetical protein [Terrabacter carboxydivorans]|uniref:Secreted protein n=1 Tax=Terrabacter carboxydivorans TaxID=619730 RepID=A0ABN3MJL1_9MICO
MRRTLLSGVAAVLMVAVTATTALADSCANVSRSAPAGWTPATTYSAPLVQGGWIWLPSLTAVFGPNAQFPPFWGKITPGTPDSILLGAPGANGNYTNGKTVSLLGVSAICQQSSQAYVVRQTDHGIQSGCE